MTDHGATSREASRRLASTSVDPRVGRTRDAILEAVGTLLEQGDDISVASIVRAAGVSRSAFYSHFASIDELATSMMIDAFATIDASERTLSRSNPELRAGAVRTSLERLVEHFARNRALYSLAVTLPLSHDVHLAWMRAMAGFIERGMEDNPAAPDRIRVDLTARFVAGATFGLLESWLRGEVVATTAELVEHLDRLTPDWYRATG